MRRHPTCEVKLVSSITREVVVVAEDAVEIPTSRTHVITTTTITITRE